MIAYTLKTFETYFPGIIEHIRVCRQGSGFSVVIRFEKKSVLQNVHALEVVVIHTPPLSKKRYETHSQDELYYIMNHHTINLSVHARKHDNF